MKIRILDGYTVNPGDLSWEQFGKLGDFLCYDRTEQDQIIERIDNADIVIVNKTHLSAKTIRECPSISYIGVLSTGYNTVDIEAAASAGIPVCNVPSYGTSSVSQFVFAHLLNICHQVQFHSDLVHGGEWSRSKDFCFWQNSPFELAGKTMGIIGLGQIGRATAGIALAMGMNVLAYGRHPDKSVEQDHLAFTTLKELLQASDVISLHCPLTSLTRGIINKDTIGMMKDGVILINTSRGALIVEEDLRMALESGKIRAAGLDVASVEPINSDNVLLQVSNCYITPHIAWAPREARERLITLAAENLTGFMTGNIQNRVN